MQELFFTILVIWILFRIINSGTTKTRNTVFNQPPPHKKTGETTIIVNPSTEKKSTNKSNDDDYVDFEEIK